MKLSAKDFFVDKKGKKLGLHKGFPFYTIGQRKGLEIALGHPAYVIKINPYKNTIRLGDKEDLLTTEMLVESPVINTLSIKLPTERFKYESVTGVRQFGELYFLQMTTI